MDTGFYEFQESGLGDYFAITLRADIEGLLISAGIHRIEYRDYHRVLSRVFPYAIYYTSTNNEVLVWAVFDCRRDPEWIRSRLDKRGRTDAGNGSYGICRGIDASIRVCPYSSFWISDARNFHSGMPSVQ